MIKRIEGRITLKPTGRPWLFRNARRFLAAAHDALNAGEFHKALRYAMESARLSREVLQGGA
jgi:hypothetical protein